MEPKMQPLRLSPLFDTAEAAGASFVETGGWRVPEAFAAPGTELESARTRVALADAAQNGRIIVEGRHAQQAMAAWAGMGDLAVGAGLAVGENDIYRLRQDLFFVHTPPDEERTTHDAIDAAAQKTGELVTATDVTAGRAEIQLVGPQSRQLLSRLCGLDFREAAFPDFAAKSSSVAKTTQLILRRDLAGLPCYHVIGERSLGAYLWDTILAAGADLGARPAGLRAIEQLTA